MADPATSSNTPASGSTPPASNHVSTTPPYMSTSASGPAEPANNVPDLLNGEYVGSPLKKPRASVSGADEDGLRRRLGPSTNIGEVIGPSTSSGSLGDPAANPTSGGGTGSHFGSGLKMETAPATSPQPQDEEL
jgi:hypothetical protein